MTVHGLNVHVTTRKGRQLIRELTIDPTRRYQPLNAKPPNPEGSGSCRCLETSQGAPGRIRTCAPASGGRCSIP